jgi:transglutaminase-like putative cysteine protease
MNRRAFVRTGAIAAAGIGLRVPRGAAAADWQTYELTTAVEVMAPAGATRAWLPLPLISDTAYQRGLGNEYRAEGGTVRLVEDRPTATGVLAAEWPAGARPVVTLTSRIATRDYDVDLAAPRRGTGAARSELEQFLKPSALIPTDGIVKERSAQIVRGAKTDLAKARAIYEWIVDNTFRNPRTRGCGRGDIRFMLESANLGGKCADLNALYVGLARAAALPARDVYGLRVAPSQLGFKSLGPATENVTKAQHCRAEVHLEGYGWVPADPADVRKVVLEEPPGNRPLDDALVKTARRRLFGSWEMNWVAYNYGHDVALPGSDGPAVPFLMYPQAETAKGRVDCLDPDSFKYTITARRV